MKALITGVNGFVGHHISKLLLEKGFEVFGTDMIKRESKDITIFNVDITDEKKVFEMIKQIKPDFIFHLAAISSVKRCRENPDLTRTVNIGGTENIMRACVENKINPKILITSSAHVYGIPEYTPIDESHPVRPVNEYGKSKLEQEDMSLKFFREHNLNVIISRSFNHIGPNQGIGFVCSDFAKQIAEIEKGNIKPEIYVGDLTPKRDFSDVRDIVNAYLLLLENGEPGEIYNIGSGKAYSIKEILEIMISKSSLKIKIVEKKEMFRKSEIPILLANNKKFKNLTAWIPKFSIDNSITDVLNYWRSIV